MEVVLIINGVLGAFTIYFLKDFHNNFKHIVKTVDDLKTKFIRHTFRTESELKQIAKRLEKLEEQL